MCCLLRNLCNSCGNTRTNSCYDNDVDMRIVRASNGCGCGCHHGGSVVVITNGCGCHHSTCNGYYDTANTCGYNGYYNTANTCGCENSYDTANTCGCGCGCGYNY